jgi:hypothetical protein
MQSGDRMLNNNAPIKAITKKDRKAIVGQLIRRYPTGVLFEKHDVETLNTLLDRSFDFYERRVNKDFPNDDAHLWACKDNIWDSISWNKAISPRSSLQVIKKAMRMSVYTDTKDIREILLEVAPVCANDSDQCNYDFPLELDHKDTSFDHIASRWLRVNGEPEIVQREENKGAGWFFKDQAVEADWIAYHAYQANYQLLCKSCNASKGSKC